MQRMDVFLLMKEERQHAFASDKSLPKQKFQLHLFENLQLEGCVFDNLLLHL